jgi:peroxiredoxin
MPSFVRPWRAAAVLLASGAAVGAAVWFAAKHDGAGGTATSGATIQPARLADPPAASGSPAPGVSVGALARDFIAMSPDGQWLRLSDLRGKPVVLNFWATWCVSCLTELPLLRDLQTRLGGPSAIEVVAVNTGERVEDVAAFLEQLEAPAFRIAMDPSAAVADAYGVYGLPLTVFIDASGIIRARYPGQLDEELAQRYVAAAMAGATDAETPFKLRFVTPVETREHVIEARRIGDGTLALASKRFRCDDTYCAADVLEAIRALPGVTSLAADAGADPPLVTLSFEPGTAAESIVDAVAALLRAKDDPLYRPDERPLEIRWR